MPAPPLNIQLRYDLGADGARQSYRHFWGSIRQWEAMLGQQLIL